VYGGVGSSAPGRFGVWHVPGECTMLLTPIHVDQPFTFDPPKSGNMRRESQGGSYPGAAPCQQQSAPKGEPWRYFARHT
jgi:hypothetical protein